MKFSATCINNSVLQGKEELVKRVNKEIVVVTKKPTKSELSAVFPEWEIGISEGVKRKKRSMPRIIEGTRWAPSKRCKRVKSPDTASPSTVSLALEDLNAPIGGCPIEDSMDDELLACVFMRLNMKDLSASMRTCKRWHRVACKEDVWEHIPLPANVPGALPSYTLLRIDHDVMVKRAHRSIPSEVWHSKYIKATWSGWGSDNQEMGFSGAP